MDITEVFIKTHTETYNLAIKQCRKIFLQSEISNKDDQFLEILTIYDKWYYIDKNMIEVITLKDFDNMCV